MVKIEIVRRETIKPSSPTPDGLKRFSLSVFDQLIPDAYTPVVFFYPAGSHSDDRIRRLKQSLSEALARFYPVAGTLVKADHYVECDDRGVDFVEARVQGCRLSDILGRPDNELLGKLLPAQCGAQRPLMLVQANRLECGGVAIAVQMHHLLMDACAMSAFLKGWAATARGDAPSPAPDLNVIASRFPAIPVATPPPPFEPGEACEVTTRRFVFPAAKIANLRDKSSRAGTTRPTRVEAVSALIWKCIVNALTNKPGHETRRSIVSQALNFRKRLEPPLSENSLGNMIVPILVESGDRNDLQHLAGQLSQGLRDTTRNVTMSMSRDSEAARTGIYECVKSYTTLFGRKDINFYILSSWCRFGLYELDFGWGGPTWVTSFHPDVVKNLVFITDTRDGDGIEVLATLPEEDMVFFETDHELLEFGIVNPSVSVCP